MSPTLPLQMLHHQTIRELVEMYSKNPDGVRREFLIPLASSIGLEIGEADTKMQIIAAISLKLDEIVEGMKSSDPGVMEPSALEPPAPEPVSEIAPILEAEGPSLVAVPVPPGARLSPPPPALTARPVAPGVTAAQAAPLPTGPGIFHATNVQVPPGASVGEFRPIAAAPVLETRPIRVNTLEIPAPDAPVVPPGAGPGNAGVVPGAQSAREEARAIYERGKKGIETYRKSLKELENLGESDLTLSLLRQMVV